MNSRWLNFPALLCYNLTLLYQKSDKLYQDFDKKKGQIQWDADDVEED
jgi:hypothetical protein